MLRLSFDGFDEGLAFEDALAFLKFVPSQCQPGNVTILRQWVLNPLEDKCLKINGSVIRSTESHTIKETHI